jgi:hypothetical protein
MKPVMKQLTWVGPRQMTGKWFDLATGVVGTSTHCGNFERDALSDF